MNAQPGLWGGENPSTKYSKMAGEVFGPNHAYEELDKVPRIPLSNSPIEEEIQKNPLKCASEVCRHMRDMAVDILQRERVATEAKFAQERLEMEIRHGKEMSEADAADHALAIKEARHQTLSMEIAAIEAALALHDSLTPDAVATHLRRLETAMVIHGRRGANS